MGKGRPRHNPNKFQNLYSQRECCYFEEVNGGTYCVNRLHSRLVDCGGNLHLCKKQKYKLLASLSNNRKKSLMNRGVI